MQHRLQPRLQNRHDVPGILDEVCGELASALSASTVRWRELPVDIPNELPDLVSVEAGRRAEVRIPATETPRFAIEIADLTRGRRLLSGDVTMLAAVAIIAARRVDSVRLERERYTRELREREIAQLMSEAELRALRAQLNPHFLFNALTTIGHLIQEAPPRAIDTLLQLTTLLRAMLRPEGEFTTLGRELEVVDAYLAIERARFEDRLRVGVDVPDECLAVRIPSLLIQPLVENAIKHGIAPARLGGELMIAARLVDAGGRRQLTVSVRDSSPKRRRSTTGPWPRGVGLSSVERRLACHYGEAAALTIHADAGRGHDRGRLDPGAARRRGGASGTECRMTSPLRVVIADDERPARSFLAALLRTFDDVRIVGEANSGREAVTLIVQEKPDLALLDLHMPELDGLGVVRALKKHQLPLVAFVTAYEEYAVRAFELNAVDYLLKPVDKARLRDALNRAHDRIERREDVDPRRDNRARITAAAAAYEAAAQPGFIDRIPIRRRDELTFVPVDDLVSVVAEGELLHLFTTKQARHTITYRLKDLETQLDPGALRPPRPR